MSDIDDKLNIMQNDAKLLGSLATAEMLPQIQETYRTALSSTLQTISASIQKLSLSVAPMVKVAEQLSEPMRKYAEVTKAATEAMQVSCAPVLKTLEAFQQNLSPCQLQFHRSPFPFCPVASLPRTSSDV